VESGVIFRENISQGTELGKKAKQYIDRGELVPDDITIPMILDRLKQPDCAKGWLLDGFPRNYNQAKQLDEALAGAHLKLDYVIEIVLDREIAKNRIMGRRLCVNDNNHPNNVSSRPSSRPGSGARLSAGSAAGNSKPGPTTRMKSPSTRGIPFITTPKKAPWPRSTTLRKKPRNPGPV